MTFYRSEIESIASLDMDTFLKEWKAAGNHLNLDRSRSEIEKFNETAWRVSEISDSYVQFGLITVDCSEAKSIIREKAFRLAKGLLCQVL